MEVVLRHNISESPKQELCFVAILTEKGRFVAPPTRVLDNLSYPGQQIRSVGETCASSEPKGDDRRRQVPFRGTQDEWKAREGLFRQNHPVATSDTAEIIAGEYGGPVDAWGGRFVVQKSGDAWSVSGPTHVSIS